MANAFNFQNPIYGLQTEPVYGVTFNNNTGNVNNTFYWQGYTPASYSTSYLSGIYVPYTGANANVNLGTWSLTAGSVYANGYLNGKWLTSGTHNNNVTYIGYYVPSNEDYITLDRASGISINHNKSGAYAMTITAPQSNTAPYGYYYTDGNMSAYIGYARSFSALFSGSGQGYPATSIYLAGQGQAFMGTGNASLSGRMTSSDGYSDGTMTIHDGTITGGVASTFSGLGKYGSLNVTNTGQFGEIKMINGSSVLTLTNLDIYHNGNPMPVISGSYVGGVSGLVLKDMAYVVGNESEGNPPVIALNDVAVTGAGMSMIYYDSLDTTQFLGTKFEFTGDIVGSGYIQANTFKSSDGTAGVTSGVTCAVAGGGTRSLNFKSGIFTSSTATAIANNVVTGNLTANNLIKLQVITLPLCDSVTNGSIGRNGTGVYGCKSSGVWSQLF